MIKVPIYLLRGVMIEILIQENIAHELFAGIVEGTLENIVEGICNGTCKCIFHRCNTYIFDKSNYRFILFLSQ